MSRHLKYREGEIALLGKETADKLVNVKMNKDGFLYYKALCYAVRIITPLNNYQTLFLYQILSFHSLINLSSERIYEVLLLLVDHMRKMKQKH